MYYVNKAQDKKYSLLLPDHTELTDFVSDKFGFYSKMQMCPH